MADMAPDAGRYHREFEGRLDGKYGRVAICRPAPRMCSNAAALLDTFLIHFEG